MGFNRTSMHRLLLVLVVFLLTTTAFAQDGKSLFQGNCAQCHSVNKGDVIGPELQGIDKRRDEAWLIKWVKSSKSVIASGDAYATALFTKYNKTEMPNQNLTDAEIKAIFAYVKKAESEVPATPTLAGGPGGAAGEGGTNWTVILGVVVALLTLVSFLLYNISSSLKESLREKQGLPAEEEKEFNWENIKDWASEHKKLIAVSTLVFIVWSSVKMWYVLAGIGISQGYHPEQPIAFPHDIHAGQNGVNCLYCHNGADKGKTAGLPSLNVCMNCHKYVKEGPTYGKKEIAKIYAALDYDPATQKYGPNKKPVKWVRVHNLPDLAYFNHSQHVKVGQVECQTCHGKVEEMKTASQFSKLTMGWCIECHRTTEVKMEGNAYYTELHEKLKKKYGAATKLTVDKIGGMECARCHY